MRKNIIRVIFLFCFLIKSNVCTCSVNASRNQSVIRPVISATKYISLFLCLVYGVEGVKRGANTARLLLPSGQEGQSMQMADVIKFPFKLIFELPGRAFDTMKYFMLSGGFGGYAFITHKLGF